MPVMLWGWSSEKLSRCYLWDKLLVGWKCKQYNYYINLQNTSESAITQQWWILKKSTNWTVSYTSDWVVAIPSWEQLRITKYIDDISEYSWVTITINVNLTLWWRYWWSAPMLTALSNSEASWYFLNRITYNSSSYRWLWIYKGNSQLAKDMNSTTSWRNEISFDIDFITWIITGRDKTSTVTRTETTINDILSKHYVWAMVWWANGKNHTLKDIKIQFR